MPYCTNCGIQVQIGSNFCNNCGQSLQTDTTSTPRISQSGETVITSISGLTQGMLGRKNYVMLITSQRLMFLELSGKDVQEISQAIGKT